MNEQFTKKDYIELRQQLKSVLTKFRYEHTLGVEFTSASLAMCHKADINKAKIAGLLHDCAKCIDDDEKLKECIKYHIEVTEYEKKSKSLLHAKLGAYYAKSKYNIDDAEIINAIKYHTTGRPNMSLIEKIVFVADYIEPSRNQAPNLEYIRYISFKDLDLTVYEILKDTLGYLKENNQLIDDSSNQTFNFYKQLLKSNNGDR